MTELNKVLKTLMGAVGNEDIEVSDEEYQEWKVKFDSMSEHDKVFNLLGALSQYFTSGCRTSASILMVAVICTNRWCDEKSLEDF